MNTLSSSSLLTNEEYTTGQIFDLADKLEEAEDQIGRPGTFSSSQNSDSKKAEDKLAKACKDNIKTTMESLYGLMSQVLKDRLFNQCNLKNGSPCAIEAVAPPPPSMETPQEEEEEKAEEKAAVPADGEGDAAAMDTE